MPPFRRLLVGVRIRTELPRCELAAAGADGERFKRVEVYQLAKYGVMGMVLRGQRTKCMVFPIKPFFKSRGSATAVSRDRILDYLCGWVDNFSSQPYIDMVCGLLESRTPPILYEGGGR